MPFGGSLRAAAADRILGISFCLRCFYALHQPDVFVFFDTAKGSP
jgi:hypothetical protein